MGKLSVKRALLMASSRAKKGELIEAERLYQSVLRDFPENKQAQRGLDFLRHSYREKVSQSPPSEVVNSLLALFKRGQFKAAAESAEALTMLYPTAFIIWNILGAANEGLGKILESSEAFRKATILNPNSADCFNNLGVTLKAQGKLEDAKTAFKKAIALDSDHVEALNNMGNTLTDEGKWDEAVQVYKKTLSLMPGHAGAHNNLGNIHREQGRNSEAVESYSKALLFNPELPEACNNLAVVLDKQGRSEEALKLYEKAILLKPKFTEAYNNLASLLQNQGKLDEAIETYKQALIHRPSFVSAEVQMRHYQQYICDFTAWSKFPEPSSWLGNETDIASPWISLSWIDDSKTQLALSKAFAKDNFKQPSLPLATRPVRRPERLKVGYFSADFHDFPGMYLMAGLFEHHNRADFEIYAFSYGPPKNDEMRHRIHSLVDHFIDIRDFSDKEVVVLVRDKGIDIAIHRNGYTKNHRTGLFQYRLSPVQINYLGYPGSLGADFIDYIIADPVVIPEDQRPYYSEKVIYLPHSYQPNDEKRKIAETDTSRADFGLPENAFVLCCFNNNYKISPREFDIWMRILSRVEGSVLWLLKTNQWVEQNLSKEAEQRGINASRLVFADKLPHSEHLARHKHADLFIDTFNYNAHTTASDALWAGLPVVTKQGSQFAARVSASLLRAVGLPELIVDTEAEYEALILELARDGSELDSIKAKLAKNRLREPLFDTKRYTQHFESGLRQAYDRYFDGEEPEDIWIGQVGAS